MTDLVFTIERAPAGSNMLGETKVFCSRGGTIGRANGNAWVLPDPHRYVSSRHAVLTYENGDYLLFDHSTNGVFVNNSPDPLGPGGHKVLCNGDRLVMGEYVLDVALREERDGTMISQVGRSLSTGSGGTPYPSSESSHAAIAKPSSPLPADVAGPAADALALASALGLEHLTVQQARQLPTQSAAVLKTVMTGLLEMLNSRRQMKNELRAEHTLVSNGANNPLKFSASGEEALERLFTPRAGYLPPEEAVREVCAELVDHQRALLQAMEQVMQQLLRQFEPTRLEQRFNRQGGLLSGKGRNWDDYREFFTEFAAPERAEQWLSEQLSRAYEEQLERLRQLRQRH